MALIYLLRGRVRACEWLLHYGSAVPCLVYAAVLTVLMGLTPQLRSGGVPWLSQMLSFWPFVLIWVWLTLSTGLVALNHLLRWRIKELPFVLNHLGLFVAIVSATLGNADMQRLQMPVRQGESESRALNEDGTIIKDLGLTIDLHDFTIEYWEDGSARRYASDITVHSTRGTTVSGVVEVNKPLKVDGWKVYQYSYRLGSNSGEPTVSVLSLVRDPWLPWVYAGIFMMLAGALCLMLFMAPKPRTKSV